jgi:hypothetical protein
MGNGRKMLQLQPDDGVGNTENNTVRCFTKVFPDKLSGMRTSYRRLLRLFLVCILTLLTVNNFVPNSSKERNAANEQWRARIKRQWQKIIERRKRIHWRRIQRRRVRQELKNQSFAGLVAQDDKCDKEALPPGSFHIVVAAWKYQQSEGHTGFEPGLNYLVDLGLPNAQIFWYRRMKFHKMARNYTATSRCNISVQEVLTPNTGRDCYAAWSCR